MSTITALQSSDRQVANTAASPLLGRIPVLDGWRGLAILMVCVSHLCEPTRLHSLLFRLSLLGVDIFFVLSGYVITRSLLAEREKTGTLNLAAFYRRRAFRILPAAMTFLVIVAILNQFMDLGGLSTKSFVASAFFFRNYWAAFHPADVYTNHFWSLSIEEQFYFFWPALLLFLGNRRAVWFAAALSAAFASWRLYTYTHFTHIAGTNLKFWMMRTEFRLDGLLIGCLLALLLTKSKVREFIRRNFPKETPWFCAFPLLLNYQRSHANPTLTTYVLIAIAIASTLVAEKGLAHVLLTNRAFIWLGTISFSLYLWQQLFLESPFENSSPFGRWGVLPLNAVTALAAAVASYYLVERPMIAWGRKTARSHWKHESVECAAPQLET